MTDPKLSINFIGQEQSLNLVIDRLYSVLNAEGVQASHGAIHGCLREAREHADRLHRGQIYGLFYSLDLALVHWRYKDRFRALASANDALATALQMHSEVFGKRPGEALGVVDVKGGGDAATA